MTPTKAEVLSDWLFAFASGKAESIMLCRAAAELRRLSALCAEWEAKAATWLASPEAAQRLAGYRELGRKCAELEAERDALRADAERWRFALTQPYEFWKRIGFMGCAEDQNEAIDAAMKGTT